MAILFGLNLLSWALLAWVLFRRGSVYAEVTKLRGEVAAREHKLKTILDNAPIVFSATDANGIFTNSEGAGLQKLGRKNNQSVGSNIYEMHSQNPVIVDGMKRALSGEQVATQFVLRGISYDLFMVPERDASGKISGVSMLSVDTTDLKRMEDEKAKAHASEQAAIETSKLKSQFLATMSHEIRTPMNGVLGMTGLLMETNLTTEQREFADAIHQSGSTLLSIINDILDLSAIEADKINFENIAFELPEIIFHTLKNLNFVAARKKIQLRSEVSPDLPRWVKGDPGRLRQVLNNLIGNAIKFTDVGHVILRVTAGARSTRECVVRFEVEDTGIGIPASARERLFEAFSQADASMARRFGGTGLGLSISKQLVERMGGQIGVTSEESKGSKFWFTLRMELAEKPAEPTQEYALPAALTMKGKAPHVLLAEDNQINQIITQRMLEKMGCTSIVVTNGLDALQQLKDSDFDLVLMDCQMPAMDGLEATRQFRAKSSNRNFGIPILAMTANAMKGDEEICLAAGMNGYVSKPIAYEQLVNIVAHWLTANSHDTN